MTDEPDVVARGRAALADTKNADQRQEAAGRFVADLGVSELEELADTERAAETVDPDRIRYALGGAAMLELERRSSKEPDDQAPELEPEAPAIEDLEQANKVLAAQGFMSVKGAIDGALAGFQPFTGGALDAFEHYAKDRLTRAEVRANTAVVDGIEQDLAIVAACRGFMDELDAIGKRFAARADVRGGAGKPRPRRPGR